MRRVIQSALLWLALVTTASASSHGAPPSHGGKPSHGKSRQPNFVIIMTDDQDKLLKSIDYQPAVQKHFVEQGTAFEKHFCTQAQCCPSRVSYLTGMHGHNTNVTDVAPPWGKILPDSYLSVLCRLTPGNRRIHQVYQAGV